MALNVFQKYYQKGCMSISYRSAPFLKLFSRGSGYISEDGKYLIIGNLTSGIDIYALPGVELLKELKWPDGIHYNVPKMVSYLHTLGWVVSGSDDSRTWMWDISGTVMCKLKHPKRTPLSDVCLPHCS
jgi:hypothetical protein